MKQRLDRLPVRGRASETQQPFHCGRRIGLPKVLNDCFDRGGEVGGEILFFLPGHHGPRLFQRGEAAVDQRGGRLGALGAGQSGIDLLAKGGVALRLVQNDLGQLFGAERGKVFKGQRGFARHEAGSRKMFRPCGPALCAARFWLWP